MDILRRQAQAARSARENRQRDLVAAQQAKVEKLAARPPVPPMGPSPDVSQGIGFGTRRNVAFLGKGRKKRRSTRRHKRSK